MIIYNLYLKMLAKKQKERLFLGGVRTYIRQSMAVQNKKFAIKLFIRAKNIRLEKNL